MKIEVNYQGNRDPELEEKIRIAMQTIGAKQFSRGCHRKANEAYLWFDYQWDILSTSNRKSAKEIQRGYREHLRAHHG